MSRRKNRIDWRSDSFVVKFASFLAVLLLFSSGCWGPTVQDVPELLKQLRSEDAHDRSRAAMSLASLKQDAQAAVPSLVALLRDPNGGVRSSAAYALREIGTPAAQRALDSYKE